MSETNSNRIGSWLIRPLEFIAALLLFALMAMTCVDVTGRYLFNAPLDGATELTRLLMAGVIFAALPSVGEREDHVTVDLLDPIFPQALVRFRQLLLNLLCAVIMAVVCWRVWILAGRALQYGDRTQFLQIPVAPVVYFIALMCGVAALILALSAVYYALGRREMRAGDGP